VRATFNFCSFAGRLQYNRLQAGHESLLSFLPISALKPALN